jgi:hypothetical protein
MRTRAGALDSIMIPASVLMAVSAYDRVSDSMGAVYKQTWRCFDDENHVSPQIGARGGMGV